jgi:hypothetical protein
VEQVQPTTFAERHKVARKSGGVWVRDVEDGMSELLLRGPSVPLHGIHDMVTHVARDVLDASRAAEAADEGEGDGVPVDSRTLDEVRADVLMEMVLTHRIDTETGEGLGDGHGGLASIRATVNVTVPALALAGVTEDPAELVGRAPIDLDTARILAANVPGWERVLADPITGGVLAVDRYTRSADLTRVPEGKRSALQIPRVPHAHPPVRPRPRARLRPRRSHRPSKPQRTLPKTPHPQG